MFAYRLVATLTLLACSSLDAFSPVALVVPMRTTSSLRMADTWDGAASSGSSGSGNLEQIEFKIYPDGRIEETVRGVKGGNCHKVTDKINEMLGEVVASQPTEEMFEQEVVNDNTLYQSESDSSSSDWEGSSSW